MTMCSRCRDTGWAQERLSTGYTVSKRCSCRSTATDTSPYALLRLPPRFAEVCFDKLRAGSPSQDRPRYDSLTHAMFTGQRYADDYRIEAPTGLIFHGGAVGDRTRIAVATLKRVADHGLSGLFLDYQNLLEVLASRTEDAAGEREEVIGLARNVDVLLIEALGERRPTDWALDTLYGIVKHRYHQKRGLLVTTGLPLDDSKPVRTPGTQSQHLYRLHDTLEQRIGRQNAELLSEICASVPVGEPDSEQQSRFRVSGRS